MSSYAFKDYLKPKTKLEKFCLQALDYENFYNLSEEEFKAYSLSRLVRDNLFYTNSHFRNFSLNRSFKPLDILNREVADCNGHSFLFFSCCPYLDLDCGIIKYKFDEDDIHLFNSVVINNTLKILDSTTSEIYDYALFKGYLNIKTNWDKINLHENEK